MNLGARRRILITGATGFIGGACLQRLACGDSEIHAANRSGTGPLTDQVQWHAADLRDPLSARTLIAAVKPTHVLHSAWIATPGIYMTSPENFEWLEGGLALIRAFGEAGGQRFVGVGTCAEYDWSASAFVEDETPLRPQSLYGRSKVAMWEALQADAASYGFAAAWGRIFLPYGPGDATARLIPSIISALRQGHPVETTDGYQVRDFIFVEDISDLFQRLVTSDLEGAFNVGTGISSTVRAVITSLGEQLGQLKLIKFGARKVGPDEPSFLVADMRKVKTQLDWQPQFDLAAGLAACLAGPGRP